jgi:FkbM family methyltransferase
LADDGRPLWLYGKGALGELAEEFYRYVDRPVAGRFEHDEEAPRDAAVAVCIVSTPYEPIRERLAARGFERVAPFYDLARQVRADHPLDNGWVAPQLDMDRVADVMGRWDDETSRAHHLQFIAWRRLREEWTYPDAPVTVRDRYFIPEVRSTFLCCETLIDGGAHDGRFARAFSAATHQRYDRIYMVEPDERNQWPCAAPERAVTVDCALAEENGWGSFCAGFGFASKLAPLGNDQAKLSRVDDLGVAPTFIKLHLEGGELAALRGAKKTLERCRPVVAVTIYHDEDGLWKTADWLMGALADYRFLFRNHGWCGTGAVVYAIPRERAR